MRVAAKRKRKLAVDTHRQRRDNLSQRRREKKNGKLQKLIIRQDLQDKADISEGCPPDSVVEFDIV